MIREREKKLVIPQNKGSVNLSVIRSESGIDIGSPKFMNQTFTVDKEVQSCKFLRFNVIRILDTSRDDLEDEQDVRFRDSTAFLKGTQSLNPHNDYSQNFVDTGQRPQNFIRDTGQIFNKVYIKRVSQK